MIISTIVRDLLLAVPPKESKLHLVDLQLEAVGWYAHRYDPPVQMASANNVPGARLWYVRRVGSNGPLPQTVPVIFCTRTITLTASIPSA